MQKNKSSNLIVHLSHSFALNTIDFVELLEAHRKHILARQLLRSAFSIGANVREAQNAESKSDFIHKLKLAAKEADESEYWLSICNSSDKYPSNSKLLADCECISKVLSKIIATTKRSLQQ